MHRLTGEAFMRGRIHSVSLILLKKFVWDWNARSTPAFSLRFALILPVAVLAALAAVSCGSSGNPPQGQVAVANAGGPYFTNVGQALAFDGSQSTAPSGQSLTYAWDFGDGGTATGAKPSHTYANSGNFNVKLTVTDTAGATNSSTVPVEVVPLPVSNPGGPYTGKVNVAVTFNGSASTVPPGQTPGYSWNFGDNSTGTGVMPTHAYSTTGTFTVTLSVKDDTGGVGTNTTTATITAGPSPSEAVVKTFLAIGSSPPGQPRFAFVATSDAYGQNTLSTDVVNSSTGMLTPNSFAALPPANQFDLRGINLDPLSRFLDVVGSDSILIFAVAPTSGALAQQNTITLNGGIVPEGGHLLAIHPSGKFAFLPTRDPNRSASSGSSTISVFSVDATSGALVLRSTVPIQIANPNFTLIDPTGEFLFVSGSESVDSNGASAIGVFSIDPATGALTATSGAPVKFSTRLHISAMTADTLGRFIYAVGSSLDSGQAVLSMFSIDWKAHTLAEVPGSPLPVDSAGSIATSVTIDPIGRNAFVLTVTPLDQNLAAENIRAFSLDGNSGVPTPVSSMPVGQHSLGASAAEGALTVVGDGLSRCGAADTPPSECDSTSPENVSAQDVGSRPAFIYVVTPGDTGMSVFSLDPYNGILSAPPSRISPLAKLPSAGAPQ